MSSLVLNLPDRLAARLRERAAQRGESVEALAVGIFDASPLLAEEPPTPSTPDLLEAFLGTVKCLEFV
jgi:plasmid stability protein